MYISDSKYPNDGKNKSMLQALRNASLANSGIKQWGGCCEEAILISKPHQRVVYRHFAVFFNPVLNWAVLAVLERKVIILLGS
jgi:hypothetical protein